MGPGQYWVTGKGGVQGSRQTGQELGARHCRGLVRRNEEEDISLGSAKAVGTTQGNGTFLSVAPKHLRHHAGQADSNSCLSDQMK